MTSFRLTRRDLLRWGLVTGGAALLPGGLRRSRASSASLVPESPPTTPFVVALPRPPVAKPVSRFRTLPDPGDVVNLDGTAPFHVAGPRVVPANTKFFRIVEKQGLHSFHPELPPNSIWKYNGIFPGPTFVARSGAPFLVRFTNQLPVNDPVGIGLPITAVHRHGGFQAPEDDGYPLDTFTHGQSRDYFFPNIPDDGLVQNEHSTLWYHDHAIDITAQNVYRGLAGLDKVDSGNEKDTRSQALRLPSGEFDVPLVVQDKRFDASGMLFYDPFDHDGFLGDKCLVNGVIQPFLRVARRKYRFRALNGSNARFYEFFLSSGAPFVAIATDDHLFEHPVTVESFRVAPAQRVEVIVDFSHHALGDEVFLENRLVQTDGRKPDGIETPGTPLMKFVVDRNAADPSRVPATLRPLTEGPAQLLPRVRVERTFRFDRSHGGWTVSGELFDENRINATPKRGEPEIWNLEGSSGGWAHPIHIHLSEFFVLSRDGLAPPPLEQNRRDTIVVGPNTSVKILIAFPLTGRYVFHCHNIEHEDMRMMGQFEVRA